MNELNILSWSGPSFLSFLLTAGVAVNVLWHLAVWALRTRARDGTRGDVDPFTVGLVAEGMSGAIRAALVSLAQADRVRFEGARVYRTAPEVSEVGLGEFERRVLRGVPVLGIEAERLLSSVASSEEAAGLAERAERDGLILTADERSIAWAMRLGPNLILLALGCLKLISGAARGKPVLFLAILLAGWTVWLWWTSRSRPLISSHAGEKRLSTLRHEQGALELTVDGNGNQLQPRELALASALFTTGSAAALVDARLFLKPPPPPSSSSGGGDSGGSSCSSSSCGSGCGGGCGGCS